MEVALGGAATDWSVVSLQIDWVNQYHRKCREVVGAELERQGRKEALDWLCRETQPIA